MAKSKQQKAKEGTGVLLMAHGHPMYAHYAYNLAVGLRFAKCEHPIAIITSGRCLDILEPEQRKVFDIVIPAKTEWITDKDGTNYLLNKLYLDDATPFEKTLFLDVDMVWNPRRKVSDLLAEVDGKEFQPIVFNLIDINTYTRGAGDWMDYKDVAAYAGVTNLAEISSELMYFESTNVFKEARKAYNAGFNVRPFAGGKPDEPYLMAAYAKVNKGQTPNIFVPTYWQNRNIRHFLKDEDIYNGYYAISAGGNLNAVNTVRIYNTLTGAIFNGMGIKRTPYKLQHKRNVLKKERALL